MTAPLPAAAWRSTREPGGVLEAWLALWPARGVGAVVYAEPAEPAGTWAVTAWRKLGRRTHRRRTHRRRAAGVADAERAKLDAELLARELAAVGA